MESLNKREYKAKLEKIRDFYRGEVENYFIVGSAIKHKCDPIAFPLHTLVETLIARELYQLDREENGGGNDQ